MTAAGSGGWPRTSPATGRSPHDMVATSRRSIRRPRRAARRRCPSCASPTSSRRWREVYEQRRLIRDPVIEEAFAWVAQRAPAQPWTGLVHGDYRLGNMLVDGGGCGAILDWELAYLGDVRFDLGYLAMPRGRRQAPAARTPADGDVRRRAVVHGALRASSPGDAVNAEDLATFQMLGIMMLLATQLTATWMYAHGQHDRRADGVEPVLVRRSAPGHDEADGLVTACDPIGP